MKKKLLAGALSVALLASTSTPALAGRYYQENYYGTMTDFAEIYLVNGVESHTQNEPITIHVDGRYLPTDTDAAIVNGRTLIPVRAAGEAVGAEVNWDQATSTATATKDGKTATFTLNSKAYTVNGEQKTTDTAPILISNRTMLPLRVFAEAFDAEVTWDQNLYDVSIDTAAPDEAAPNISAGSCSLSQKIIQKYYVPRSEADPYVGSWRRVYSGPGGDNGYNYEGYLFFSKVDNGYSMIQAVVSVAHNGNPDEVVLMKETAAQDHTLNLIVNYTNNIFYSMGPYFGPINNRLTDTYHKYSTDWEKLEMYMTIAHGQVNVIPNDTLVYYKF